MATSPVISDRNWLCSKGCMCTNDIIAAETAVVDCLGRQQIECHVSAIVCRSVPTAGETPTHYPGAGPRRRHPV